MGTSLIEMLYTTAESMIDKSIRLIGGKTPTDTVVPFKIDPEGVLAVSQDSESSGSDSAGKLRVSEPRSLYDLKHQFDKSPDTTIEVITDGGGTPTSNYVAAEASVDLTVNATGDKIYRRSKIWIPYEPGRSQNILVTGTFQAGVTGIEKRMGYFDSTDGVYFQQNGAADTDYKVVVKSSTAKGTQSVNRADWDDPLDGSGPSGATVDLEFGVIFSIDFLWLGYDRVRFSIKDKGTNYTVHTIKHDALTGPYMNSGSKPIAFEIENVSGGAVSSTLRMTCATVFSEGGFEPVGRSGAASEIQSGLGISGVGTSVSLLSIRLKSTHKRGLLVPVGFNAVSADNKINLIELIVGGTLSGNLTGWVSNSSGVEVNKWSGTGTKMTLSGGKTIFTSMSSSGSPGVSLGLNIRSLPGLDESEDPEILTVRVTRLQSGNSDYTGTLNYSEIY